MHADDMLGVDTAKFGGDDRAGVAALGAVPVVAEAVHQLAQARGDPASVPARSGERAEKPKPGREGDDVEGVRGVAAMAAGRSAGLMMSMNSTTEPGQPWVMISGRALGSGEPDVQKVHVLAVDDRSELGELVQPRLLARQSYPAAQ